MSNYDLNFGGQVHCRDGRCGKLTKVAVKPDTMQVMDLIVEKGFLLKNVRVFPLSKVSHVANGDIYLDINSSELGDYPVYQEKTIERVSSESELGRNNVQDLRHESMVPGSFVTTPVPIVREKIRQGVPDELAVIGRATPVEVLDWDSGNLDHLLVEAGSGWITHLVMQRGLIAAERWLIPNLLIDSIDERAIQLRVTEEGLAQLPRYEMAVADEDGAMPVNAGPGEDEPGKRTNGDLTSRIESALLSDPRTSDAVIEVIEDRGIVTIQGRVADAGVRRAAERLVSEEPGVVSVTNALQIAQK